MSTRASSEGVPTRANHDDETPVNYVRLSESLRQFIVDECVVCGETHYHGSMDPVVANGGRSHRVEHCHGVDHQGGYYLQLPDDHDAPARWYSWVDKKSEMEVDR